MPSPRTVLADIHDLKLDPTKAHTGIKASGHLHKKGAEVVDEKPVRNGLVELAPPPPPAAEVKPEPQPEAEPVVAAKKQQPPPPKKAKKDKPEEPKADDSKPDEEPSAS